MSVITKKGKKGLRKHGRDGRKPCKIRYKNENRRYKNKLKKIRKSEGEEAVRRYQGRFFGIRQ